jgi:hypothetical protein
VATLVREMRARRKNATVCAPNENVVEKFDNTPAATHPDIPATRRPWRAASRRSSCTQPASTKQTANA